MRSGFPHSGESGGPSLTLSPPLPPSPSPAQSLTKGQDTRESLRRNPFAVLSFETLAFFLTFFLSVFLYTTYERDACRVRTALYGRELWQCQRMFTMPIKDERNVFGVGVGHCTKATLQSNIKHWLDCFLMYFYCCVSCGNTKKPAVLKR